MQPTPQEIEKIKDLFDKALDKSFQIGALGSGTPLWMNLMFILEKFNQGNYYGTIAVKIIGTSCQDAKELEVTHKLRERY